MQVDERFTVEITPEREWIEAGVASWDAGDGTSLSVRHHVRKPEGGFDPYSSGEIPVERLGEMVNVLRAYLQDR